MKLFPAFTLVCCGLFLVGVTGPLASAQSERPEGSIGEIAAPDADGVFATLTHKGDIVDFLKILGIRSHRNIVPSARVRGNVTVGLFDVTFDEALDAVLKANSLVHSEEGPFIFVYTKKEFAILQAEARKMESRRYLLNYIRPEDAVELIGAFLSDGSVTALSPSGSSSGSGSRSGSGSSSGSKGAENWTGSNCLVVRDYPEVLAQVEALLSELDKRPPQVLVEATILAVRLSDTDELGIDFNALGGVDFTSTGGVVGSAPSGEVGLDGKTTTSLETGFTANVSSGGLSIGIVSNNIGIFIKALETITDTVTLGNPKILTLNRQEGQVMVGREEGYLTTETTATSTTQTVEMLETGTILRFTPFVMDDGYIRMELNPEDSTGRVVVKGGFALPEKETSEVTTNILVKDGHTIVIGGLFRDAITVSRSQVPWLGNLPILGTLFRSTTDTVVKEELIFLITPHIVRDGEYSKAGEAALEKWDVLRQGIREGQQWHTRLTLAQTHYQRAMEHNAKGNKWLALQDVNLACYISPTFSDALRLRNELRSDAGSPIEAEDWTKAFVRDLVEADEGIGK